jgi:ribosomal protein S12
MRVISVTALAIFSIQSFASANAQEFYQRIRDPNVRMAKSCSEQSLERCRANYSKCLRNFGMTPQTCCGSWRSCLSVAFCNTSNVTCS